MWGFFHSTCYFYYKIPQLWFYQAETGYAAGLVKLDNNMPTY